MRNKESNNSREDFTLKNHLTTHMTSSGEPFIYLVYFSSIEVKSYPMEYYKPMTNMVKNRSLIAKPRESSWVLNQLQ